MKVAITGAAGNLGGKLRRHLQGRHDLVLLDRRADGDPAIRQADLSIWDPTWVEAFRGVDVVVHLAADPTAQQTWPALLAPNIDAAINVFAAAVQMGVRRVVYASSNHVMGGYKDREVKLTTDLPPLPGARYTVNGQARDSGPYGATKLFGERLGKFHADAHGLSVLAVRIGWVRDGDNRAGDIPPEREAWFRLMWLSNRDYCQFMEKCIEADQTIPFAVLNAMSANTGMTWDLTESKRLIGYEPLDDVMKS